MIIRSQDKHGFVNLGNIDTVCMDAEWNIYAFNGKANSLIGTYSTEEKAIKVLDMIQEAYAKMRRNDCMNNGSIKEYALLPKTEQEINLEYFKNMYCFNMPQDSEV